ATLGEQYIKEVVLATKNLDELTRIITQTDATLLRNELGDTKNYPYLGDAVTQENVNKLREAAALQLLTRSINDTTDEEALKALADTRSLNTLKDVLEKHPALNLSGANIAVVRNAFLSESV